MLLCLEFNNLYRLVCAFYLTKYICIGCTKFGEIYDQFANIGISDRGEVWNTDLIEALELENLITNGA